MANKHRKVWKVVSRKPLSRKQTWPKREEREVVDYHFFSTKKIDLGVIKFLLTRKVSLRYF